MNALRLFRIEDVIMREMVECQVTGNREELEELMNIYTGIHETLGKSHEEALTAAETAVGISEDFAFGG